MMKTVDDGFWLLQVREVGAGPRRRRGRRRRGRLVGRGGPGPAAGPRARAPGARAPDVARARRRAGCLVALPGADQG